MNEETEDPAGAPGRSAVASTIILVLIYLVVATAALAFGGAAQLKDQEEVLNVLGTQVFGDPWDKILIIAVLTSAAASTQTTILPTARTTLSMARVGAMPEALGRVHDRYLTPHVSTILMGVLSIAWYVGLTTVSENILFDSIAALGLMIAFYYGLTGFACAAYYRREVMEPGTPARIAGLGLAGGTALLVVATLLESNAVAIAAAAVLLVAAAAGLLAAKDAKAFALVALLPSLGAEILTYVFFKSCLDLSKPENSESGDSWLGLGPPLAIGYVLWSRGNPEFFRGKSETFRGAPEPVGAPTQSPAA